MLKREAGQDILVIFIVILMGFFVSGIPVNLNIPFDELAPYLALDIPDQVIVVNNSLENAFSLYDYFKEDSNTSSVLNFSYSSMANITMVIDSVNGNVSFYPDLGFNGTRQVTFYAVNEAGQSASSNLVSINVTYDYKAPWWTYMRKDKTNISQNVFVNFSSEWADDFGLGDYFLSINQGGGWMNKSPSRFPRGISGRALERVQISAPGGSIVYWRFYARDLAGNINATDIKNFSVDLTAFPAGTSPPSGGLGGGSERGASSGASSSSSSSNPITVQMAQKLKIEPSVLEFKVKQGSRVNKFLKITNLGDKNESINLGILFDDEDKKISDNLWVSDYEFTLESKKSKSIALEFNALKTLAPDAYFGKIIVETPTERREVVAVVKIDPLYLSFDLEAEVLPDYKAIQDGRDVLANITLRELNDTEERNISLYFSLKDFEGHNLNFAEEQVVLRNYLRFTKNLTLPENSSVGDYFFYVRAYTENESMVDIDDFVYGQEYVAKAFFRTWKFFSLLALLSAAAVLFIFKYYQDRRRLRILNLYILVSKLKKMLEQDKIDEAIQVYVRIKASYGETLSDSAIENKEALKEEMKKVVSEVEGSTPVKNDSGKGEATEEPSKTEDANKINKPQKSSKTSIKKEKAKGGNKNEK